ncbi:unnamed protein product [Pleuronectes platessa]|uniref:Uncharacterized protein n=1 Tax=Pleuronectes platessa TaxID=8262 RepID=A0A9N7VSC2_PLEPL|nr:unnamed protein product [Pleuronectes platessa]
MIGCVAGKWAGAGASTRCCHSLKTALVPVAEWCGHSNGVLRQERGRGCGGSERGGETLVAVASQGRGF